ncbi:MAG: hypothetical protein UX38_C0004G0041 [Microgenomates group bacterium GW2011_GWC1_46_16]|nr:MAG: hypothetical protein UX38_C0004G0041 [Microgenomates group bacterium GW2011_GWC1_46_16]
MKIQVLGSGCPTCQKLHKIVMTGFIPDKNKVKAKIYGHI